MGSSQGTQTDARGLGTLQDPSWRVTEREVGVGGDHCAFPGMPVLTFIMGKFSGQT